MGSIKRDVLVADPTLVDKEKIKLIQATTGSQYLRNPCMRCVIDCHVSVTKLAQVVNRGSYHDDRRTNGNEQRRPSVTIYRVEIPMRRCDLVLRPRMVK